MKKYIKLIPLGFFLLQGCSVGPDYQKPKMDLPNSWKNAQNTETETSVLNASWWENFEDPLLNDLMAEAVNNNWGLKEVWARLEASRQQLTRADAALFPEFDMSGSYDRERMSKNAPGFNPNFYLGTYNNVNLGVSTSWELDVFGRIRRSEEIAQALVDISVADVKGVLLSLYANVTQNYIILRSAQTQCQFQHKIVELSQEILRLTQDLMSSGLTNQQTVEEAQSRYEKALADQTLLEIILKTALHQLAILLGKPPAALYKRLSLSTPVPLPPLSIFSDLPSTLLEQRPDIQAAERTLAQATAEIGLMTGDLFPKFSLTGSWGYNSTKGSNLINSNSTTFGVGPSFSWPIFDFGRIRDSIRAQEAERDAQLFAYHEVVLKALSDVETALVTLKNKAIYHQKMQRILASQENKLLLTQDLYKAGTVDYLTVLTQHQAELEGALQVTLSAESYSSAAITLYKSLGAGIPTESKK